MTTIANSPVEAYEQQRLATAKRDGYALFPVAAGDGHPAFVYTIGMAQVDFPELLCFVEPGMEEATLGLMSNLCPMLIESVQRFGRAQTLRAFCTRQFSATDPQVTYKPQFLQGDTYLYALKAWVTRAVRFRQELGMPQVIELQHAGVPTLDAVRAQLMLSASA